MKTILRLGCAAAVYFAAGLAAQAHAEDVVAAAPTEAQAKAAFMAARDEFLVTAQGSLPEDAKAEHEKATGSVSVAVPGGDMVTDANVDLEDIQLVMDVEGTTLRDVVREIVGQAATYTGPWTVKWRLSPENREIMDEKVNLTAEARFGEFCKLLTERVKNMTGTQLFVTAFNNSRVILVTDSY